MLALAASQVTVKQMRWHRRVLIIAAPASGDPVLAEQRQVLARWRREVEDRDVAVVEIIGDQVSGSVDHAARLRSAWRLPADRFTAILVGKDGGEKMREDHAIGASALTHTIDAMPMRQAGQR